MQQDNSGLNPQPPATITISVAGNLYALPKNQLIQITETGIPTPLPFAPLGIEGMVCFDNKPLIQINVAQALGLKSNTKPQYTQTLIVNTSHGVIALKIEHIVTTHAVVPTLPLENLVANLAPGVFNTDKEHSLTTNSSQQSPLPQLVALIVAIGATQVAILIEPGLSVEQATLHPIQTADNETKYRMAMIGNRLLPVRLLIQDNVHTGPVIIGRIEKNWHAVLVTKFIGLQPLNPTNLVLLPNATIGANLCIQHNGATFCLYNFATLANSDTHAISQNYQKLLSVVSESQSAGIDEKIIERKNTDGIKVSINGSRWQIPLPLVERLQTVDLALLRKPESHHQRPSRLFVAKRWFFPFNNTVAPAPNSPAIWLRLTKTTQIALLVDSAILNPTQAAHPWLPLPTMPYTTTLLFDAVRFEAATGNWILRVNTHIQLAELLHCCSRILAQSCIGRLTPDW